MWFFNKSDYLICCRHSTAEAKQASFVVGKTCKKRIDEAQREKLSFTAIIGRQRWQGIGLWWVTQAWVLFQWSKMEMSWYLKSPIPKKSIVAEETKIYYTFLVSPRIDKVTGQNFLQQNPYFVITNCYLQ